MCVSVGCVSVRVGMWACEYTCICVRVVNEEVLNVGQGHYGQRVTPAANMTGVVANGNGSAQIEMAFKMSEAFKKISFTGLFRSSSCQPSNLFGF